MTKVYISFSDDLAVTTVKAIMEKVQLGQEMEFVVSKPELLDVTGGISEAIREADILIAVLGKEKPKPNAMLEIGYALGAGKQVALVTESGENIVPLSLAKFPMFVTASGNAWITSLSKYIASTPSVVKSHTQGPFNSPREHLQALAASPQRLDELPSTEFESLIVAYIASIAPELNPRRGMNAKDYDIVLSNDTTKEVYFIEVKKPPVQSITGIDTVIRLTTVFEKFDITAAILISAAKFSDSALDFATNCNAPIKLFTLAEFLTIPSKEFTHSLRRSDKGSPKVG